MGSQLHPTHAQLHAGAAVQQAEAQSQPVHLQPQIHAHFPVQSNPAQVGLQQIEQNALNQEDPDEDQDEDEALDDGKMHSDVAQFGGPSESVPGDYSQVHTVLLPLGGCELPLGMPSGGIPGHFIKVVSDSPLQMNMPHRLASLTRFREKRKDRSFYKKVRYAVRKENADRKNRHKGRFVSTKIPEDERTKLQGDASEAHGSLSGSHDSQLQVM